MIKRLTVFDFDGTLIDSPEKETGKVMWSEKMGKPYPYIGWWGRPESLDLKIFDIKPFPSVLAQLKREQATPNTYVVILTSRMEKLRPQVEAVLIKNKIHADKVDMKRSERTKGQKILDYIDRLSDLVEVNVFEDRDTDIETYQAIKNQIPENITFNIFQANQGKFSLIEYESKVTNMIQEELQNFFDGIYKK